MTSQHFVILSFPAQGHINPNLQFSKRLLRLGVRVTFMTSEHVRLSTSADAQLPKGLNFIEYNDGYDGQFAQGDAAKHKMVRMKQGSCEALRRVVLSAADEGCPITCIMYSLMLPFVAAVARDVNIPSAILWIQPATVFDIYYYYFHGFDSLMHDLELCDSDSVGLELPGLPVKFTRHDLPSFLKPGNLYSLAMSLFAEHMAELDAVSSASVLVNTFDSLEPEALKALNNIKLTAIGPLIPSAFLDGEDQSDSGFGGDLFRNTSKSYIQWLDSKPKTSVIYISFGSISVLSKDQMEEIGRALLNLNKPFIWVIRGYKEKSDNDDQGESNENISCVEELEQLGLIVPWCSQLQVLSHPSLNCFFTHCGWNSTIESLISGVPMVGYSQWTDQLTNAKLVEDYWNTGVRVTQNENGLVERDEIKRCLEHVMEDENMRLNAMKWKKLAINAVKEGGSSDKNLKDFVMACIDIRKQCH